MKNFDFSTYLSPFTWRYGSEEMKKIFSEEYKFKLWRRIWIALAKAQQKTGLISKKELDDLIKHKDQIDIEKIIEIEEKETRHDVVAAIREFGEKAKIGAGKIHLGATSMDIVDNADTIRIKEALEIIESKLKKLIKSFGNKIKEYADLPCMGYTHLQPAEPTTLGYRLAFYAQDLLLDLEFLKFVKKNLKSKGIKGAVGTSASFMKLLNGKKSLNLESNVMRDLEIDPFLIANQTTPRKIEFVIASTLASIAQSLYKFAFDLRVMQSPNFGEWQEPFGQKQVGSSAMPFKKNPWKAEQICSLARLIFSLSRLSLDNASHMLLERTLDDSGNRRVWIPEIFLAEDEILTSCNRIVEGLLIHEAKIKENLNKFGSFSATEEIIIEAVKKGADRQKIHEELRNISMHAWKNMQEGGNNTMPLLLLKNKLVSKYLTSKEIMSIIDPANHTGDAEERALKLVNEIEKKI